MNPRVRHSQKTEQSSTQPPEITAEAVSERPSQPKIIDKLISRVLRHSRVIPKPVNPSGEPIIVPQEDDNDGSSTNDEPASSLINEDQKPEMIHPENEPAEVRADSVPETDPWEEYESTIRVAHENLPLSEQAEIFARNVFEKSTPWDRKMSIVNIIKKVSEGEVFSKLPNDSEGTKEREHFAQLCHEVVQIQKEALEAGKIILNSEYSTYIESAHKELMKLQERFSEIAQYYYPETVVGRDDDKSIKDPLKRKEAMEIYNKIESRLNLLAALSGEPRFTLEQSNRLREIKEEFDAKAGALRLAEQQSTAPQEDTSPVAVRDTYLKNRSWLQTVFAVLSEQIKADILNLDHAPTPEEFENIKRNKVTAQIDSILSQDPRVTEDIKDDLQSQLLQLFIKSL
jgi:hypothetical protein